MTPVTAYMAIDGSLHPHIEGALAKDKEINNKILLNKLMNLFPGEFFDNTKRKDTYDYYKFNGRKETLIHLINNPKTLIEFISFCRKHLQTAD